MTLKNSDDAFDFSARDGVPEAGVPFMMADGSVKFIRDDASQGGGWHPVVGDWDGDGIDLLGITHTYDGDLFL